MVFPPCHFKAGMKRALTPGMDEEDRIRPGSAMPMTSDDVMRKDPPLSARGVCGCVDPSARGYSGNVLHGSWCNSANVIIRLC